MACRALSAGHKIGIVEAGRGPSDVIELLMMCEVCELGALDESISRRRPFESPEIEAKTGNGESGHKDLDLILPALTGQFDNQAQLTVLAGSRPTEPKPGTDWLDGQAAAQARIDPKTIAGEALYLEWRALGDPAQITRQRVWVFRAEADGEIRMSFYTIKAPERFAGAATRPEIFDDLTADDLIGYPANCDLNWGKTQAGFEGRIPAGDCKIIAQRSGRAMTLEASITVTPAGFTYREAGILADGTDAFRVPGAGQYEFERRK